MAEDLDKLGTERRLIFENLANGVPIEQVMAAFRRSEAEVLREMEFVGKKLREYRFKRHLPPLACETLTDIRFNRRALLDNLTKLGPRYLTSSLELPRIFVETLDPSHIGTIREVAHRTGQRVHS